MGKTRKRIDAARSALSDPERGWRIRGRAALAAGAVLLALGAAGILSQIIALIKMAAIGIAAALILIGAASRLRLGVGIALGR